MKKITLITLLAISLNGFAQFTTGVVPFSGGSIRIDTNTTLVSLTLTGPSTSWLGVGFGGTTMSSVTDMFIWNASANRDYVAPGGHVTPGADAAGSQSWTEMSNTVSGTTRTIVYTRPLVSAGDYTFLNDNSTIPIIYNQGTSTTLANHGTSSNRGALGLTRTQLGVEDFSLNATYIFPNPSKGDFTIASKTNLEKINIYSQIGTFVKTIEVNSTDKVEVSVKGLSSGIYLLELQNATDKSWKKIIVE